ncbi:DUF305 domain-containing protein [Mycobacterium sp. 236(2023)]|uniref:DUF305 domain-containing protein n=1 Tax=Mycobacterium sp. 236(2023) TaxID=3038163 RepID=UPI0024158B1D|nr:DUF305 domain-containing protein [Mycobacterium sp. 236(2023)]MDG4667212.1 DUF305 domain-containing protein [Mycobacterium sp. 236(2023)]
MERWKRLTLIGAVAMLVGLVACASADTGRENPAEQTTSTTATTAAAGIEAHNNADVWFVRRMIPYHQQEIEMSDILLGKQGVDPRVTDLAIAIKATRVPELEQMQNWLYQWDVIHPPEDGGMVGQLTERELGVLSEAQGADASRLFLTQMIAHHDGAISLAQAEIEEGQFSPAVAMARAIAGTQQQQVDTMKGILTALQ